MCFRPMSPLLILTPFIHLNVPEANVTIVHLIPFIDLNVFEANVTIVHLIPFIDLNVLLILIWPLHCPACPAVLPLFILTPTVAHHVSAQRYHCSFWLPSLFCMVYMVTLVPSDFLRCSAWSTWSPMFILSPFIFLTCASALCYHCSFWPLHSTYASA